jgi:MoaA/NifB/PqqE/SkfB family radical SAM enzyme
MSNSKLKYNYLPEFRAFISGRPKPSMVTVNLTGRCNQRCVYCEIGQGISSEVADGLTREDLFWVLDEISSHGIRRISLCGGEPFLFNGLMEVVDYATQKHIRCSITTNGMTVFKLEESDIKVLRKNKADINLSIDSLDETIQSLTRGVPNALSNALLSFKKLKENKIPVTVLAAISRHNYRDLYDFVVSAHKTGIRQVLFQPVIHHTNYPDRKTLDDKFSLNIPEDQLNILMMNLGKILEFEKNHAISTNVYRILPWIEAYIRAAYRNNGRMFFEDVLGKFYCREIHAAIDIAYDGGIQPCGLTKATINIHDRNGLGLIELWERATASIKKDITNGDYYDYCNACCHKFSRNMIASIMKYPLKNRVALLKVAVLVLSRISSTMKKKIFNVN